LLKENNKYSLKKEKFIYIIGRHEIIAYFAKEQFQNQGYERVEKKVGSNQSTFNKR